MKLKSFFGRVGGKRLLAERIYKYFPKDYDIYIEPFIGAGSLYLKVPINKVRIINDLDADIYNLWNDLDNMTIEDIDSINVDKYQAEFSPEEKTDFGVPSKSRELFDYYLNVKNYRLRKQRFIRNMYLSKFSFGSNRRSYAKPVKYRNVKLLDKKLLIEIKKNLEDTIILNKDYKQVIKKYDNINSLIYLDPPYELTKDYTHKDIEKNDLLKTLLNIKGKFIMSYNYSTDNVDLFSKYFNVVVLDDVLYSRENRSGKSKEERTTKEILVMNY